MEEKKTSKRKHNKNSVKKESKGLEAPRKIKILVSIVERSKADFYLSALEGFDVNMQTVLYAKGTAPTELQRYLGIIENGKAVILSIVNEDRIKDILIAYEDKFFKTKNGKGVAFTIPISSIIGVHIYQFLANIKPSEV